MKFTQIYNENEMSSEVESIVALVSGKNSLEDGFKKITWALNEIKDIKKTKKDFEIEQNLKQILARCIGMMTFANLETEAA